MSIQEHSADEVVSALPCAAREHPPLDIQRMESGQGVAIHGAVRTTSTHWDGCGGRTDLHDVLAAMWAVVLRANGVASSRLIDIEGMVGSPELYGRWLVFEQPFGGFLWEEVCEEHLKRLMAHTAWAYHEISETVRMVSPNVRKPSWREETAPSWVQSVRALTQVPSEELWVSRKNPDWQYYTANKNALSIVELNPGAVLGLRRSFAWYNPMAIRIGGNYVLRATNMVNVVSSRLLSRGNRLIKCVEGDDKLPWKGLASNPRDMATIAIPLETHCVFLGSRTIVTLRQDCGHRRYLRVRDDWECKNTQATEFFNFDASYTWSDNIDSSRLEELVRAVLGAEPGLEWIRLSGHALEGDGGRDMIAQWMTPPGRGEPVMGRDDQGVWRSRRLVIQVKGRDERAVGKTHVRDVRDTLERFQAKGFFLVALPRLSNGLIGYLETLPRQGYWVDWWSRVEMEDRLRRRPDIAARFTDVVKIRDRS